LPFQHHCLHFAPDAVEQLEVTPIEPTSFLHEPLQHCELLANIAETFAGRPGQGFESPHLFIPRGGQTEHLAPSVRLTIRDDAGIEWHHQPPLRVDDDASLSSLRHEPVNATDQPFAIMIDFNERVLALITKKESPGE